MSDICEEVWQRLKIASQEYARQRRSLPNQNDSDKLARKIIDGVAPGLKREARDFYIAEFSAMLAEAVLVTNH